MVADMVLDMVADININMEIQFGERVGHGGWLIGPKLFRLKAYPICVSFKICEFILISVIIRAARHIFQFDQLIIAT